jgi:hypothetical protein
MNNKKRTTHETIKLSRLAGRHGLTFIFRDAGPDEGETAASASSPHDPKVFATWRCSHPGSRAVSPILGGAMKE